MNMRACLVLILCLLAASLVCNVALTTLRPPASDNRGIGSESNSVTYLTLGGNVSQPDGEDKGGGGWP